MSELTPLEERLANLTAGINGMSSGQKIMVNRAFLEHVRADMAELVALRRAQQPDNTPLTLEELRGMDGEPVRVDDDGAIFYGIVSLGGNCFTEEDVITLASGDFYLFHDMDVKVYPLLFRKPEGGDR